MTSWRPHGWTGQENELLHDSLTMSYMLGLSRERHESFYDIGDEPQRVVNNATRTIILVNQKKIGASLELGVSCNNNNDIIIIRIFIQESTLQQLMLLSMCVLLK